MKKNAAVALVLKSVEMLAMSVEVKEKAAQQATNAYNAKLEELRQALLPVVLSAIQTYNANASLLITPGNPNMGFNFKKKTFVLGVRLHYSSGQVPDEELTFADEKRITRALKKHLAPLLKNAGIPLTFQEVQVPAEYFQK